MGHEQVPAYAARTQDDVAGNLLEVLGHHHHHGLFGVSPRIACLQAFMCVFVHAYACVCLCVCVHVLHACVCMQTYLYAYRSIDRCLPLYLTVYVCTSMSYQVCLLDCGCMHIRYVIIGLQPDLYCFRVRALLLLPNHADIRRGVEPRRVPMLQCAGDSLRHIRPPPCTRRLLCDRPQGRYLSAAVVVGGREWAR